MVRAFHLSSVLNRASIEAHGLDSTRMAGAPGIAGSRCPEHNGVFVCLSRFDLDFFVSMNNTGTPVDVWAIDGLRDDQLVESENGFSYVPGAVPVEMITLVETALDRPDEAVGAMPGDAGTAYRSSLIIEFDDGTVLREDSARRFVDERTDQA